MRYIQKVRKKSDHKILEHLACYTNTIKSIKMTLNSKQRTLREHRKVKKTKTSFQKEWEENADLCKPVMNKIMITHE